MSKKAKLIFQERSQSISVAASKYQYDEVVRGNVNAHVNTDAHYIPELRALIVDQICIVENNDWRGFDIQWSLPERRTLETHETEAAAIRRAVNLADEYHWELCGVAVDDTRSDEEIIAVYNETHQTEGQLAF